jgi:CubicO group peptidase (beta-lactamase class C family)
MRPVLILSFWLGFSAYGIAAPAQPATGSAHDLALAAGYKAAFLCSGIFNAGQSEAQIAADDLARVYPGYRALLPGLPATIDRARHRVSVRFSENLPPRVAAWRPYLGCAQLPVGADPDAADLLPALAEAANYPSLANNDAMPWPQGDAGAVDRVPGEQGEQLDQLTARAFDRQTYGLGTETTAVVIVHRGRIVGERYRAGYDMHTPQRTWSVAKSIAVTILGAAVEQGIIDLEAPLPLAMWRRPGDPRGAISWRNLLHMSSGLWSATAGNRTDNIYFGGMPVPDMVSSLPLDAVPGERWRYANNDTMIAAMAMRQAHQSPSAALRFPFSDLLWPVGMTRTTLETDWQGNFILSSQVWTTARDLARLGLLYLNDGRWAGEQLLPPDWSAFVAMPSPAQPVRDDGVGYGAQF